MKNEVGGNSVSTVVLRGSTDSILDDLERAVDDGVNTYKVDLYQILGDYYSLSDPSKHSSFVTIHPFTLLVY